VFDIAHSTTRCLVKLLVPDTKSRRFRKSRGSYSALDDNTSNLMTAISTTFPPTAAAQKRVRVDLKNRRTTTLHLRASHHRRRPKGAGQSSAHDPTLSVPRDCDRMTIRNDSSATFRSAITARL
jgi:hypothetical protein